MANGGSPAQRQIQESAETLERRKLDQELRDQLARTMSEPMIDPRLGRMADPISTPVDPLAAARKQYQQDLARYLNTDMSPLAQEEIDMIAKAYPEQHAKRMKTLDEVMTPEPYQAPSIEEIKEIQSGALDRVFGNTETMNQLDRNLGQFNRKYNPIVRGIEAIAPYPTKAGLEVYEAIDEFRKRNR